MKNQLLEFTPGYFRFKNGTKWIAMRVASRLRVGIYRGGSGITMPSTLPKQLRTRNRSYIVVLGMQRTPCLYRTALPNYRRRSHSEHS